jgi:hypothetical protein
MVIGAMAMNFGGPAMAQKPATVTQYVSVFAQEAMNDRTGQQMTQILNSESQQGFTYVGSAGLSLIFKK